MMYIKNTCLFFLTLFVISCKSDPQKEKNSEKTQQDSLSYQVVRAQEWTAAFKRNSGWFGGDGIFAIPYSGNDGESNDSIMFLFSDTMIGQIDQNDSLHPGYKMVNNSMAFYKKGTTPKKTTFKIAKDKKGDPESIFIPKDRDNSLKNKEYYWLGDGFVNSSADGDLYLFAYRIQNTDDKETKLPFKQVGNDLIMIPKGSKFPYKDQEQLKIPFNINLPDSLKISFGSGIFVNTKAASEKNPDGYIYVYGVQEQKHGLVCARVKPNKIKDFDAWKFYNSMRKEWVSQVLDATTIADNVSNELSVSKLPNGSYGLVYQEGGIYPTIMMEVGATPVGPFKNKKELWDTSTDITDPDLFTYNAKAHPAISPKGELLITYNVNSFKFFDIIEDKPHLYRPRFIKLKFKEE